MQKPRLKPSFQLLPADRVLVEKVTGQRFPLSQGQIHVAFLLDGTRTPADLRAEFLKRGADVQIADIEKQIALLRGLGAIDDAPAPQPIPLRTTQPPPAAAPAPARRAPSQQPTHVLSAQQVMSELALAGPPTSGEGMSAELGLEPTRPTGSTFALLPLTPTDRVPLLRADLKMRQSGQGVIDVDDPVAKKSFKLYDFEVSIARMLNGQRTVAEVMEAVERLGLPVTPDSFKKFVRQLQLYGFIAQPGAAPAVTAENTAFSPRERWDPSVRELFVSGVRMLRQGKFVEAQNYFSALLETEPGNAEAQEMLSLVESRLRAGGAGAPAPVAAPVASPDEDGLDEGAIVGELADGAAVAEPLAPATAEEVAAPPPPSKTKARLRRWIPRVIVLGVLVGVLQVPLPMNVSADCQLVSANRDVVRAVGGGFVREIAVTQGQFVEKGTEVARLSSGDLEKQLVRREAEVAQAQSELELVMQGARPEEIGRTRAVLSGRAGSWRMAKKEFDRLKDLYDRKHVSMEELSKAEERMTSQYASFLEAAAQLKLIEAGARPEEVAKRQAELRARSADRDLVKAELRGASLVAPISGVVTTPNLKEKVGVRLEAGAVLLEIEDMHQMRVIARVAENDLDLVVAGQKTSIKVSNLPSRVFEGEVTFISPVIEEDTTTGTRFFRIESVINNEDNLLRPNLSGYAKLHAGERPLWAILTRGVSRWLRLRFLF